MLEQSSCFEWTTQNNQFDLIGHNHDGNSRTLRFTWDWAKQMFACHFDSQVCPHVPWLTLGTGLMKWNKSFCYFWKEPSINWNVECDMGNGHCQNSIIADFHSCCQKQVWGQRFSESHKLTKLFFGNLTSNCVLNRRQTKNKQAWQFLL